MDKNIAYISLGTNIGNRELNLQKAISLLQADAKIQVGNISSIYETDPVGYTEQARFLNMVAEINTSYTASELIKKTMEVEASLGRQRTVHWGPRTIDLDILLYNQDKIESDHLIVPHPRMVDRAFVLIPLFEIVGDIVVNETSLKDAIKRLHDKEGVHLWKQKISAEEFAPTEN
ncbi:2-amino-4-hydroxy-6-hydroxymethyldihydropteridine diphosphokinase [Lottiidibacillus patelloidae]|uniref:2-amino-4-hydroxy-6-hydroxymethyldihydropteridine diphosphokinase n=1 Tax=Lottiidibacillus patelloidae TaxID=2670334 RepID=A0A263BQ06_9BACI|nr:2-amino-4-hydroxy-6-hydroxymethyldihydropteridine diphosphokinase [Lottiidibacillus patelloidae]OZM55820.1 2-amino-4-hydroxy-6-hydroxymethyldihydropteridine diphosphokinase [Lottiidibacillus patelloidae]